MILNKAILIGITGGIATGKSTVSNIILEKGYPLIDADKIAREVVTVNRPAYLKILQEFGEIILLEDKNIDRNALGKIIFEDENSRIKLNRIVHPYIFESIKLKIDKLSQKNNIIFLDIPLLFEQYDLWEKYNINFQEIWLIYVNKDVQINRLIKRDNITEREALSKIDSQMPIDAKKAKSSKIIDNSGDLKYLENQIDKTLSELI